MRGIPGGQRRPAEGAPSNPAVSGPSSLLVPDKKPRAFFAVHMT